MRKRGFHITKVKHTKLTWCTWLWISSLPLDPPHDWFRFDVTLTTVKLLMEEQLAYDEGFQI